MHIDVVIERLTKYQCNEDILAKQLNRLCKAAERNRRQGVTARYERVPEPEACRIVENGQEVPRYRYTAKIRLRKDSYRSEEAARRYLEESISHIVSTGLYTGCWRLIGEAAVSDIIPDKGDNGLLNGHANNGILDTSPIIHAPDFILPSLNPGTFGEFFKGIYNRDAHIRIIHKSAEAAAKSNFKKRSHILLYGKPASCKTKVFEAFKKFYESTNPEGTVIVIDRTTMTAAGWVNYIIRLAKDGVLPRFILLEEIEKGSQEDLKSLLSMMDSRANINKLDARKGKQREPTPLVICATCHNVALLKGPEDGGRAKDEGAMWSRFTHRLACTRPDEGLMEKILLDEIAEREGNPAWAKACVDFGYNVLRTSDPREFIGMLDGGDSLLTGQYQRDKLSILEAEQREMEVENFAGKNDYFEKSKKVENFSWGAGI